MNDNSAVATDTVVLTQVGQDCLQQLMREWFEFERRLNRVPIITRLESGRFTIEDYLALLLNLRQQVIEGSRWITRCASSFNRDFADVRSVVIGHAKDEHRDYEMLEQDFITAGGVLADIQNAMPNPGTEALHAFLMHRASQPNPIDLIGAMWIIEGLGQKLASKWADRIDQLTEGNGNTTRFLRYHGANDDNHMSKLYRLIDRVCETAADTKTIARTAAVVGRLYCMQLEEIDNG